MEEKVLKLISQLALIALIVWVVASGVGKRDQASLKHGGAPRRQFRKSIVWNQSPVQAPSGSSGLLAFGVTA
jgi:hypothetical protein